MDMKYLERWHDRLDYKVTSKITVESISKCIDSHINNW